MGDTAGVLESVKDVRPYVSTRVAQQGEIHYKFRVAPGQYDVTLLHCDAGARAYAADVILEDKAVADGIAVKGAEPLAKTFETTVSDGVLDLKLVAKEGNGQPVLSAIVLHAKPPLRADDR